MLPSPPLDIDALSKHDRMVAAMRPEVYQMSEPQTNLRATPELYNDDRARVANVLGEFAELSAPASAAAMAALRAGIETRGGTLTSANLTFALIEEVILDAVEASLDD